MDGYYNVKYNFNIIVFDMILINNILGHRL